MPDESCALRALTLCDGQAALTPPPRIVGTRCYCAALVDALVDGDADRASRMRTERARAVARSAEIERIRRWRLERF